MNLRFCKVRHNPPEKRGDCIAACVNTLLDSDDVPHTFNQADGVKGWEEMREYLKTIGKTACMFPFLEEPFEYMKTNNPDVKYIMLCSTSRGEDHAVVCVNDEIVHNPAWTPHNITGAHSMGYYIVIILGDI